MEEIENIPSYSYFFDGKDILQPELEQENMKLS